MQVLRRAGGALVAALMLAIGGCAHAPNENLKRAEVELEGATADPLVAEHAPLALEDARRSFERARRAYESGDSGAEVDHLAYLASRRVEIARLSAQREADVERAEELSRRSVVVVEPVAAPAVRLEEIEFDGGRTILAGRERPDVERAALWARSHPGHEVVVEGHADESEADPLAVSEARASSVADALVRRGVAPERVRVIGLGDSRPLASSDTSTGRALNRRVEILAEPR